MPQRLNFSHFRFRQVRGAACWGLFGWSVCCLPLGCEPAGNSVNTSPRPVLVSCAASLQGPVTQLAARFTEQTQIPVQVSGGPSQTLAQQILSGAPAEVYVSAHVDWVRQLEQAGLVEQQVDWVGNRLVLVKPAKGLVQLNALEDLTGSAVQRVAVAAPEVPLGRYSEQSLESAGVWPTLVDRKVLIFGHDARATLRYVAQGEVDAAVVYATDAAAAGDQIQLVEEIALSDHEPIVYPLVLVRQPPARGTLHSNERAARLFDWLQQPAQLKLLQEAGFTSPVKLQHDPQSQTTGAQR